MSTDKEVTKLSKKDFETDQEVRWCPGCGDYAVLAAVQRFLPSLGIPREKFVFISGIGCSSRFPYYMNTYGMHTIHGRAPALATGLKLSNPDLSVWMITGDGDCLSIGGNHILHLLRRNPNINVLLFNNRIYGLTKGQYSPTSEIGKVTKSSPMGSQDKPVDPILFALGAGGSFVARTIDRDAKHMTEVLQAASNHKGTSFIEIYQNCNIFNDGAFLALSERDVREDNQLRLKSGELLIFGKEKNKGISIDNFQAKIVQFEAGNEQAAEERGVVRYDPTNPNLANLIARLHYPEFPEPVGVFYQEDREVFEDLSAQQLSSAQEKTPLTKDINKNLSNLFSSTDTWVVQ